MLGLEADEHTGALHVCIELRPVVLAMETALVGGGPGSVIAHDLRVGTQWARHFHGSVRIVIAMLGRNDLIRCSSALDPFANSGQGVDGIRPDAAGDVTATWDHKQAEVLLYLFECITGVQVSVVK